ncbi:MAG: hypothetical protein ABIQ16_08275 [Polyangiaceae bacterium]
MKPDSGDWQLERLSAGDAPELHDALVSAKQQLPDAQQLAALAISLSARGVPTNPFVPAPPATRPAMTHWRLWVAAGVMGPVVLALALWPSKGGRPRSPAAVAIPSVSTTERRPTASPSPPSRSAASSSDQPRGAASALANPAEAVARSLEASSADVPPQVPRTAPIQDPQRLPAAAASVPRAPAGKAIRAPSPPERAGAVSSPSSVAAPTEVALLRDAQLALRTNPNEALTLTEQHQSLFARGAMVQERELIAISALARLGRHTAVLARAAQFAHDFPSSPYRKQIEALAQ